MRCTSASGRVVVDAAEYRLGPPASNLDLRERATGVRLIATFYGPNAERAAAFGMALWHRERAVMADHGYDTEYRGTDVRGRIRELIVVEFRRGRMHRIDHEIVHVYPPGHPHAWKPRFREFIRPRPMRTETTNAPKR